MLLTETLVISLGFAAWGDRDVGVSGLCKPSEAMLRPVVHAEDHEWMVAVIWPVAMLMSVGCAATRGRVEVSGPCNCLCPEALPMPMIHVTVRGMLI